ncbi:MAG: glycoside hydrolase family 3 N-terminal domain-containing protein [Bacteroidota bacterium]
MRVFARFNRLFFPLWVGITLGIFEFSSLQGQSLPEFLTDTRSEEWADSVLNTLNLKQQIAQLYMVAAYSNRGPEHTYKISTLIENYEIGGLIFFQGGPHRQAVLTNHYQKLSKLPLLLAMDAEWGVGMRLDSAQSFPYQITLGAIRDNTGIYYMGEEIARQFKRLGMHVNFAPVLDINKTPSNPVISYRAFGEHRELVYDKGDAYSQGLQAGKILATGKHFPGHGDTDTDSHYKLPLIPFDKARLDSVELYPFAKLFNQGLGGTMIAHLNIPSLVNQEAIPSTLSKDVVTGLLKEELGYKGMIFTDAMNMKAITNAYPSGQADLMAFKAGNDVLEYSLNIPQGIETIYQAVRSGEIDSSEVSERCKKVLRLKAWSHQHVPRYVELENLYQDLHTPRSEYILERLGKEAITVLRNTNALLPLKRLDSLDVGVISIDRSKNDFQPMLSNYSKVSGYYLSPQANTEEIDKIREILPRHNTWILSLHQTGKRPNNTQGVNDAVKAFFQEIAPKCITVVFRNPYTLNYYPGVENSKALVMGYESTPALEKAAAQVIFGAVGASGRLPVTVNEQFPFGQGLETEGGIRLEFASPEDVGWKSEALHKRLDSIVESGITGKAYPGAQLLVAKKGKVVFHKAYGYHTYDSLRQVQLDDIYDYASLTKVTGPLPSLMYLHGDGKIDLDKPFHTYWPDWKRGNKKGLIFRDVLAHQAQLKAWIAYWTTSFKGDSTFKKQTFRMRPGWGYTVPITDYLYLHKDYKEKQIYKQIRKSPLEEKPGYLYSGLSFYLYPRMIENLTGTPYVDFTYNTFYNRLGAYTIRYNPSEEYPLHRIIPTERDTFFRMHQIHGKVHDEGAVMMGGVSGNAGLFSTSLDLAKLMQMYMNEGTYGGERYLNEESVNEFTRYQFAEAGNRRGLGFDKPPLTNEGKKNGYVAPSASEESFGHSGYTGTFTWADPKEELIIVFFSNRVYPTRNARNLYRLNIRPSLHQVLYEME